jgi:energy-coupling factor transporter ATP-binding protein EcfA2
MRSTVDEHENLVRDRQEADRVFKDKFQEQVPLYEINAILQNLDESFEIDFEVTDSDIQFDIKNFIAPKIAIKVKDIDDKGDFKNHFNEGKLKLISIAIYFALAKKYEVEDSDLKLLVLDDFLTSLDMSNRKLIIQYVLENFGDYQKIILTHNLQFYNMVIRLLKVREEDNFWDIKNIFLRKENSIEVATITDRNENYLLKAEDELNSYHLEISGNFMRKEFERIINEFEQLLELGRVEELDNVIKALKNLDNLFPEPSKNLKSISNKFNNILANSSTDDSTKYRQLKDEIEDIPNKLRFRNSELFFLKETILKTEFYKNILMNASSHDDTSKELYRKEFQNSIKLLKELNKILNNLK